MRYVGKELSDAQSIFCQRFNSQFSEFLKLDVCTDNESAKLNSGNIFFNKNFARHIGSRFN